MSANIQQTRNVEVGELIEFAAVAEYRSFARAAVQLGVPTAALTRTIRVVEERLGQRLLDRAAPRVVPTSAGQRLLGRLRAVLAELESTLAPPAEMSAGVVEPPVSGSPGGRLLPAGSGSAVSTSAFSTPAPRPVYSVG